MTLQEIFEDLGYETRSYSGRGMYGSNCLGVEISGDDDLFSIGVEIGEFIQAGDRSSSNIPRACTDSLGRGTILYFPNIEYKDYSNDSEELDEEEVPEKY